MGASARGKPLHPVSYQSVYCYGELETRGALQKTTGGNGLFLERLSSARLGAGGGKAPEFEPDYVSKSIEKPPSEKNLIDY